METKIVLMAMMNRTVMKATVHSMMVREVLVNQLQLIHVSQMANRPNAMIM
jgi:hypothetical protein